MNRIPKSEQETAISFVASERDVARVYTIDPVWQRKLKRAGHAPYRTESDGGEFYVIEARYVSIRSARSTTTDRSDNLPNVRQKRQRMAENGSA